MGTDLRIDGYDLGRAHLYDSEHGFREIVRDILILSRLRPASISDVWAYSETLESMCKDLVRIGRAEVVERLREEGADVVKSY